MLQKTIRDVKNGIEYDGNRYRIYVIGVDGIILYVGKSSEALSRMESHVGTGEWLGFFGSTLDHLLIKTEADNFVVEFYSEDDISQAIKTNWNIDDKVSFLEEHLIYELSPVYNAKGKKKSRDNSIKWYSLHPEPVITSTRLTQRAVDGACESCKLELTPSCPIRTGNGCDLFQPRR